MAKRGAPRGNKNAKGRRGSRGSREDRAANRYYKDSGMRQIAGDSWKKQLGVTGITGAAVGSLFGAGVPGAYIGAGVGAAAKVRAGKYVKKHKKPVKKPKSLR